MMTAPLHTRCLRFWTLAIAGRAEREVGTTYMEDD